MLSRKDVKLDTHKTKFARAGRNNSVAQVSTILPMTEAALDHFLELQKDDEKRRATARRN